jgi:hypothetical protein
MKNRALAFLGAYALTASIKRAAELAGVRPQAHYRRMKVDPEYAIAFAEAHAIAVGFLESEAVRRATEGVMEPVFWQGEVRGHKLRYSDTLLLALLEANAPEKWRKSQVVTGPGGGAIIAQLKVEFVDPPAQPAPDAVPT